MAWFNDPAHPFTGISEKLRRSNENILNLHKEVTTFFEGCEYPTIPDRYAEGWQEAVRYHGALAMPPRFGVLSGEVIHHLRSCLDHIVWHFSSTEYRASNETSIQFPVLQKRPVKKDEIARYERNIKGISNRNVLKLIEGLQPYHRGDNAINDPLCIIHDMDRFDKHRELVVTSSAAGMFLQPGAPKEGIAAWEKHHEGNPLSDIEAYYASLTVNNYVKLAPQIAFSKVGNRGPGAVIPTLTQLKQYVIEIVMRFHGQI